MNNLLLQVYNFLDSPDLLFLVTLTAIVIKIYIIKLLIVHGFASRPVLKPLFFLFGILIGSLTEDITWALKLVRTLYFIQIPYYLLTILIRISWAFFLVQYQSIVFFVQSLVKQKYRLSNLQKIICICTAILVSYFLLIAFFDDNLTNQLSRDNALTNSADPDAPFEIKIIKFVGFYWFIVLALPVLFFALNEVHKASIPKILKKQLRILMLFFICPYIITELIIIIKFYFISMHSHTYFVMNLSTVLIIAAIYYSMNRVMGLRFLNFENHVRNNYKVNFIDGFKDILEELSHATNISELQHIIQLFFKKEMNISPQKTYFFLCNHKTTDVTRHISFHNKRITLIEDTLNYTNSQIYTSIYTSKVVIYDEVDFSNFYEKSKIRTKVIHFMQQINADIFIPIFEKEKIIGSIVIDMNSRFNTLYGSVDRDKMLVFASYLGNIINLLQNRNFETILQQKQELIHELDKKTKEIGQYKESMRSFLRKKEKEIGIIFYKNRRFIFANKAAKELIAININNQIGHPLSHSIRTIARQVDKYKTPQRCFTNDIQGNSLVLSAVPNLGCNNIIITVYYPEISDIVKKQIDLLHDPTKWDYLLYLETTKSGQLINQLIPGSGETLLNFKIDLLKISLSTKATLIEVPGEDLIATVELIHHISLRKRLHTLKLDKPVRNNDIMILLFGINPLFGLQNHTSPLFEKLHSIGTLFIKNIHNLDLETQDSLASFIKYGYFTVYKSDRTVTSNVRIICSTNQNLENMVKEQTFSKNLFAELKKASLIMPDLTSLSRPELNELADGFTAQVVKTQEFKSLLELTEKEKSKLSLMRPVSLKELKTKIQHILIAKSKENHIYHETKFDPAFQISDPDLIEAARLGKQALRDPKIMTLLWHKFNKNQNKIATLLGVNRSSVNRRCKEYNLH